MISDDMSPQDAAARVLRKIEEREWQGEAVQPENESENSPINNIFHSAIKVSKEGIESARNAITNVSKPREETKTEIRVDNHAFTDEQVSELDSHAMSFTDSLLSRGAQGKTASVKNALQTQSEHIIDTAKGTIGETREWLEESIPAVSSTEADTGMTKDGVNLDESTHHNLDRKLNGLFVNTQSPTPQADRDDQQDTNDSIVHNVAAPTESSH